jgi:hypothetical protein
MRKIKTSYKAVQKNKRKMVVQYLREFKKKFKLDNIKFKVTYVRGSKVKDFYAEILMTGNRVQIKFNEDLMEQKPQEIQDTVIHELLHVILYKLMTKIISLLNENIKNKDPQKLEDKLCDLEHEVIEKLVPVFLIKNKIKH